MVDQEVTDILEEIRSRVRASEVVPGTVMPQTSNGDRGETEPQTPLLSRTPNKGDYASLAVIARAWDRLPPVVSSRRGATARLELWIKSKLKTALRWFTWEQVNFNAATHRTFLELIDSLSACEQQLITVSNQLKSQLDAESSAIREQLDAQRADLLAETQTRRDLIARQQTAVDSQQVELNKQWASLSAQQAELNERLTELTTIQSNLNARLDELKRQQSSDTSDLAQRLGEQNVATESQLSTLVQEFRERDERLLDEQRVCFRQLALELSESQVMQDRGRRDLESRLTKLETPKPK